MSSRVKTLLIPYVFWNIVPFLLMVIAMFAGVMLKVHPIEKVQTLYQKMVGISSMIVTNGGQVA